MTDIEDMFKHLSNYTIQKKNKKVENTKTDLCLSSKQFEEYVQVHVNNAFTWKNDIFPKLKTIIIESLRSGQENIKHKNNCFEVYGFDFVLDQDLTPWLIEVNLSPACAERTSYLKEMLNSMADGVLDLIEVKHALYKRGVEQIVKPSPILPFPKLEELEKDLDSSKDEISITDAWVLIHFEREKLNDYADSIPQRRENLELIGQKANLKEEKKLDKLYTRYMSVLFIQKVYRGHVARRRVLLMKKAISSVVFQKYVR